MTTCIAWAAPGAWASMACRQAFPSTHMLAVCPTCVTWNRRIEDCSWTGLNNIHQSLMFSYFPLIPRVFIDEWRPVHRFLTNPRRQGHWTRYNSPCTGSCLSNLLSRRVKDAVIKSSQPNSNPMLCHTYFNNPSINLIRSTQHQKSRGFQGYC